MSARLAARAFGAALTMALLASSAARGTSAAASDALSADQVAAIDALGAKSVSGHAAPGVTIAIQRGGNVVYAKGFGLGNVEFDVPANAATRYPIGSNTKQFTATAVLLLQDEGKLDIDRPLATYLPEIPHARDVTVRDLLTHAGGYAEYTAQPDFDEHGNRPTTAAEVVASVDAKPLAFKPGTKREYSNTGYQMLALLIERVSGMSYGDFLATKIFTPLGMTHTYVRDSDDTLPDVATEYSSFALGPWEHALHIEYTWFTGAGAIISDANDLFAWDAALDGGKLLTPKSQHEMMTPVKLGAAYPDYGFGIEVTKMPNGHRAILHGGNTTGAATQDARFPDDDDLRIVVLANSGAYDYSSAVTAIYSILVPSPAATPAPAKPAPAASAPASKPLAPAASIARAQRWLDDAIAGKIDDTKLRPTFKAGLSREHRAALRALATLGPRTYKLVVVERRPPATGYEFLLETPKAHLIYVYLLDDDGLVAQADVIERTSFAPAPSSAASPAPAPAVSPAVSPTPGS